MGRAVSRKPPSRLRYEEGHPTVSCRVSLDIYQRLDEARNREGKSLADFLKIGLGMIEVQAKKEAEVRKQASAEGYARGHKEGYAEARRLYRATYPCGVCGQSLEVTTEAEKEAVKKFMPERGWGHAECHKRR